MHLLQENTLVQYIISCPWERGSKGCPGIFKYWAANKCVGARDIMVKRRNSGKPSAPVRATIARLRHEQQVLWRLNLALAVILFFILSVWWICIEFGYLAEPGPATEWVMEIADLIAILVFAIELYRRYRKTKSKAEFLKKNWLEILALLPVGLIFRAGRIVEEVEIFRSLRLGAKLGEAPLVIPEVVFVSGKNFGAFLVKAQKYLAHYTVFSDFFALLGRWKSRLLR